MILAVSDLDGTLLNKDKRITRESAKLINDFIKDGNLFSVATARTAGTAVLMLKGININCPVILMNGAMIYDIRSEKYVKYNPVGSNEKKEVIRLIKENNASGFVYSFDKERIIASYEQKNKDVADFYDLRKNNDKYKVFSKVDSLYDCINYNIIYFALMGSFEPLEKIYKGLLRVNVSKTFYPDIYIKDFYYLEIFSHESDKGKSLAFLREYTGAKKIIAFGDNYNDLSMKKYADKFVVPSNGVSEIKNQADDICKSNDENGVARYLKEKNRE